MTPRGGDLPVRLPQRPPPAPTTITPGMPKAARTLEPVCVVVTTYARPDELTRLLDDIEREFPAGADVRIYDDATPRPDAAVRRRLDARGWTYRRAATNHGKKGWWRWWNVILDDLRVCPAVLFIGLQDDMRLCERFLERCLTLWSAIPDPTKASLYLDLSEHRADLGSTCWTPVQAAPVGPVVRSGWVDLNAFVCHRRLLDALTWRLEPVPPRRWDGREELSSGVGQQVSLRAQANGLGMYRVEQALVVHDDSPSLMNPAARRRWPMRTMRFIDGEERARTLARARPSVCASLATIPTREQGLRHVVESLLPQVDRLQVYLNGYDHVPEFLASDRVEVARSQVHGDRGDAGKFFWSARNTGYQLVCDDDIDFPEDYVHRLVAGIERHRRQAVVGFHGSLLRPRVIDYYRSRRLFHLSCEVARDQAVHVLGTGVSGYHTSTLPVGPDDFHSRDLADVWLAVLGQQHCVPFIVLEHASGWLEELPGFGEDSLYARARHTGRPDATPLNDATRAVHAQGPWRLHVPTPGTPGASHSRRASGPPLRGASKGSPRARPALVRVEAVGPGRRATLILPERDHITAVVQRTGTYYERDLLDAVRALAVPGVYVDVGAHFGNHTAFFALECAAEHVICVEPNPVAFAGLGLTVAENGLAARVTTARLAAHPRWRHVALRPQPWRTRPSTPAYSNSGALMAVHATAPGDAPAAPLDEILTGAGRVGLLKVDVGAGSVEALASATGVLERDRPVVVAEAVTAAHQAALRSLLAPLGYRRAARYGWTPTFLLQPAPRSGLTGATGRR
jgi:FkbM family methyltransferase